MWQDGLSEIAALEAERDRLREAIGLMRLLSDDDQVRACGEKALEEGGDDE
jgi:hypothetical protein